MLEKNLTVVSIVAFVVLQADRPRQLPMMSKQHNALPMLASFQILLIISFA